MIVAALINILYLVLFAVTSPLRLLSDVSVNSTIVSAITTANGYISAVPFPLFIVSLVGAVSFYVVFEAFYWGYKLLRWLYMKIPGVS